MFVQKERDEILIEILLLSFALRNIAILLRINADGRMIDF